MEDLFRQFWWLIFPVGGMAFGLIQSINQNALRGRMIDVLRTYAEQGKEPPPEVLKALTETSMGEDAPTYRGGRSSGPVASAWWTFIIFLALTAGFAAGMGGFGDRAGAAFLVVTIIMAVLASGSLVMALAVTFRTFRGKK